MPLAEIGTRAAALRLRCINRRLVTPLCAMKPGAASSLTYDWHRHHIDNNRAAVAEMTAKQHAATRSCAVGILDEILHDEPGEVQSPSPGL